MADKKETKPKPPRTTNPNTTNEVRGNVKEPKPNDTPKGVNKQQLRQKPEE
jgi:hypothetical protein